MARLTIGTIDRMGKGTSMTVATKAAATVEQHEGLVAAVDALILGAAASAVLTTPTVIELGSAVPPADENANRENKMLLRVADSVTGKVYTHEMGTFDNAALPSPNVDFLDLTAGAGLALKTAFELVYESPAGNAGTLVSVQQVNRGE